MDKKYACISLIILLLSGFGLVFNESVFASQSPPEKNKDIKFAGKEDVATEKAQIEFQEVVHDFGEVSPKSWQVCGFKFKNTGEGTLKIKRVTKTCGCTPFSLDKKEYKPGEEGKIKVKYHAGSHGGITNKHLYVFSNDPENKRVKLTIRAEIVPKVTKEPDILKLSLNKENAGCPPITLKAKDDRKFAIKSFNSTNDVISYDFDPDKIATEFVFTPEVDKGKLASQLMGWVTIKLTHPECKEIKLHYEALARYDTQPSRINLFGVEAGKPVDKDLWVLNNYDEDFSIESVNSENDNITVEDKEKIDKRYKLKLKIVPPEHDEKTRYFRDVLTIKMNDGSKVEITCNGFYSRT